MDFDYTQEQQDLRDAVAKLGRRYGHEYFVRKAKAGEHSDELWDEAAKLGYLGVSVPEEFGGGGGGITELAIVCEELAAAGAPLLLLVVSPAIAATIVNRHGTQAQRERWLPGFADGTRKVCFAITEPDAGSNFHKLSTVAKRDGDEYVITGRKVYISGVDECSQVVVVARMADERTGKLKPALFMVPTDAPGLTLSKLDMEIVSPENQFLLFFDEVRVPADTLIGEDAEAGLPALFAGLNPERITVAAMACGTARYALERASTYTASRSVWGRPIGSHQGVAHPMAHAHIQVELARLMVAKAAALYDAGRDLEAGVNANMAKYASAEASALAVDTAIQAHGGNGMTTEYGVATLLGATRAGRIAPVSREMILNFVAQHLMGQEKSY
ncbi:acyl-CoA dehydrogenase [Dactylosporangium aurantiacum]|uniref:Acyl-CoA dehydrogenase n=1 Tax=Dactylosporangium aurantiacum TaxID=35754 RepID=A0A9Q9IKT2_9ACTN|nr:acyl-CoA dehydrogenase [Dactylosporangium aurantiacum]MDG6100744.1 acyl-CoA dehydrogenase [Dactylosporangium aurantiacum]UWZ55189.1 acyl-CoA dehydrogenase [Dactylosporangium aurantiacum]